MTPKEMLERAIAGTQGRTPQPITDEFVLAIAKRLEARGIVKVPGLPDEDEPELEWYEKIIELNRRHEEFEREREARKQAEQEAAATAQQTTTDLIRQAMAETHPMSKAPIPLNGAAVLRAALAGGPGTMNGEEAVAGRTDFGG
jgi:hypothetical protein